MVAIVLFLSDAAGRIGLLANTVVHVFMYYYFALSALGINVWWKKVRHAPHC